MHTENEVVDYVVAWLQMKSYAVDSTCHDNQRGDDIAATAPDGSRLFVECKGAESKRGNVLDDWHNSAMAIFGAIKEVEERRPNDIHAIAVPDTTAYRKTMGGLDSFFLRQRITLLWVQADGAVVPSGALIELSAKK